MASRRHGRSRQRTSETVRRPGRIPLAAHRAFAPLLGIWGALLGAGVVLVLPAAMIEQLLHGTLIGTWGTSGQPMFAAIAAGLLGLLLFGIAAYRHVDARRHTAGLSVIERAARQVTPINPARDLGSQRLDDPVETMPFSTPAWRMADFDNPLPAAPAARAPEPVPVPEPEHTSAPRELDLAAFGELLHRNGVWVEEPPVAPQPATAPFAAPEPEPPLELAPELVLAAEPAPAAAPDPVADIRARRQRAVAARPAAPGTAALARLRGVPLSELSLAQMVERFAGALHEVRETAPGRSLAPADLAAREAALAEALKALEALRGEGSPAPRPRFRDVLLPAAGSELPQMERARGAA